MIIFSRLLFFVKAGGKWEKCFSFSEIQKFFFSLVPSRAFIISLFYRLAHSRSCVDLARANVYEFLAYQIFIFFLYSIILRAHNYLQLAGFFFGIPLSPNRTLTCLTFFKQSSYFRALKTRLAWQPPNLIAIISRTAQHRYQALRVKQILKITD